MAKLKSSSLAGRLVELSALKADTQLEKFLRQHGAGVGEVTPQAVLRHFQMKPAFGQAAVDLTRTSLPILEELGFSRTELGSVPKFAADIRKSARFTLSANVTEAMRHMQDRPIEQILDHMHLARPAFNDIWVEYKHEGFQYGFMVRHNRDEGSFNVRAVMWSEKNHNYPELYAHDASITFGPKGYSVTIPTLDTADSAQKERVEDFYERWLGGNAKTVLCIFLLMNSRSRVLETTAPSIARNATGGEEPVALSTIRFDLSRIRQRHPGMSEEDAERAMAETLVRGHFKLRKIGLLWWDPHLRNRDESKTVEQSWADQLARPRADGISRPERELGVPGTDFVTAGQPDPKPAAV